MYINKYNLTDKYTIYECRHEFMSISFAVTIMFSLKLLKYVMCGSENLKIIYFNLY